MANEIELSVVVPVKNEAENVAPLVHEIVAAFPSGPYYEIIYVDDGSTDETAAEVRKLQHQYPQLRLVRHFTSCGQSAALRSGVKAARGWLIGTLDGDGQNDPADLPKLLRTYHHSNVRLVAGQRVKRQDSALKLFSSRLANAVRRSILQDNTADTGCGIKLFAKEAFIDLPYFDHIHRFLPALMRREGYGVVSEPVSHRPRLHGTSKYGVMNRLFVGIVDLAGVWWLTRRMRRPLIVRDEG